MSNFKSEIRKAVTNNTKYRAIQVWNPIIDENMAGEISMTIEITVKKKK